MAITRTAKGTAKAKASGTSLTVSGVAVTGGRSLFVGIGFDGDEPPDTVKWGGRELRQRLLRRGGGIGLSMAVYHARSINKTATRDLVATWPEAIGRRALFVSELGEATKVDETASKRTTPVNVQPATGQTAVLNTAAGLAVGVFVSVGPSSDAAGTPQIEDGDVWQSATAGQRDGTAGAPPVSNVTIQETYLALTSTATTRARLQNAGEREWVSGIVVLEPLTYLPITVTPSGHEPGTAKVYVDSLADVETEVDTQVAAGMVVRRVQYVLEDPQSGDTCWVEMEQT